MANKPLQKLFELTSSKKLQSWNHNNRMENQIKVSTRRESIDSLGKLRDLDSTTMEKEYSSNSALTCNLLEDAMLEILFRLPIKSILRFKCVSKSYYSLLKSPSFIKMHYDYLYKIQDWGGLVIGQNKKDSEIGILDHQIDREEQGSHIWEPLGIYETEYLDVVEVSKGLICLTPWDYVKYGAEFLVINPALRESKVTFRELKWGRSEKHFLSLGFGFDQKDNDFKIVRLERLEDDSDIWINIYSLYSDSWRQIKCSLNNISLGERGILYYNSVYWNFNDRKEIIVFNFTSEKFCIISLPPGSKKSYCWRIQPWEDDSISVIIEDPNDNSFWRWTTTPNKNPEIPCIWKRDILYSPDKLYAALKKRNETIDGRFPGFKNAIPVWRYKVSLVPVKRYDHYVVQRLKDRSRFITLMDFWRITRSIRKWHIHRRYLIPFALRF